MKKLIVLTVILGLSTVANAGLIATSPVVTGNTSWDIVGDQLLGSNATGTADVDGVGVWMTDGKVAVSAIGVPDGTGNYTDSVIQDVPGTFNPGDLGSVLDGSGVVWACNSGSAGAYAPIAGDWFIFDLSLVPDTTGYIDFYNMTTGAVLGTMEVIPEPATIALLGLGGLLLRRRK